MRNTAKDCKPTFFIVTVTVGTTELAIKYGNKMNGDTTRKTLYETKITEYVNCSLPEMEELVIDYLTGHLTEQVELKFETHLEECASCQLKVEKGIRLLSIFIKPKRDQPFIPDIEDAPYGAENGVPVVVRSHEKLHATAMAATTASGSYENKQRTKKKRC